MRVDLPKVDDGLPSPQEILKGAAKIIYTGVKHQVFGAPHEAGGTIEAGSAGGIQQTTLLVSLEVAQQVRASLEEGNGLADAIADVDFPTHWYKDNYSTRDDHRKDFEAMLRLFLYLEASSHSQRSIADRFEYDNQLAGRFGFAEEPPRQQTISYAKNNRFDHNLLMSINDSATEIQEAAKDNGIPLDDLGVEREPEPDPEDFIEIDVRRACQVVFEGFDTNRPVHRRLFSDDSFLRQYAYSMMGSCGLQQGTKRYNRHNDGGPSKSSHHRVAKGFSEENLLGMLEKSSTYTIERLRFFYEFKRPVDIAIDYTPVPYWGDLEHFPEYLSYEYRDDYPNPYHFKYATATIVGENPPIIVAAEPVIEDSTWNGRDHPAVESTSRADNVAALLDRLPEWLSVNLVLMDRDFDGGEVCHELEERGMDYLTPRRKNNTQKETCRKMNFDWGSDVFVDKEGYPIGSSHYTDTKSLYIRRRQYKPGDDENGHENISVFQTNMDYIDETNASGAVKLNYSKRWGIERQYQTMKNDMTPDIRSYKHYEPRLLGFVLGCMFQNGWRLANFYQRRRRGYFERREEQRFDFETVDEAEENLPITAGEFLDLAREYLET